MAKSKLIERLSEVKKEVDDWPPWMKKLSNLLQSDMPDDNHKIITAKVEKHKNEIAIYGDDALYQLVGFADNYEEDYYYEVFDSRGIRKLLTCVSGFTWLKGVIPDKDYERLENSFAFQQKFKRDWKEKFSTHGKNLEGF